MDPAMDDPNANTTRAPDQAIGDAASRNAGHWSGAESSTSAAIDESALQNLNVDTGSIRDSAIGGMTPQTSMMSARSSVYSYVEENGRTYHRYKAGKYMLPNDEAEKQRLDLQHQLWMITLHDELYLAPIKDPRTVLDIGTGTGIWALEFAIRYPAANVIGSDLSPMQPDFVPENCHFEVDDAEDEWNYSTKFDLIHGRALVTCFKDHAAVFKSAFDALIPGGYFEMHDILPPCAIDDSLRGTTLDYWVEITMNAAEKLGMSWRKPANYVRYFEEAGFVDVVEKHFQWPINRWPKGERWKTLGSYWLEIMTNAVEGVSLAVLTRGAGLAKEDVVEMAGKVKEDLKNQKIHAYCPVIVVYGRKPL